MSEQECLVSDWHAVGFEDGARGYPVEQIAQYRKSCADYGVAPDLAQYQAGRQSGLVEYCQPDRAFQIGSTGAGYRGVCPVELEAEFLPAYQAGKRLHTLESGVRTADSDIQRRERALERMDEKISAKEAALITSETTQQQRAELLADLKELSEKQGRYKAELRELYAEKARREDRLAAYRSEVEYY
jgi:hypothetical protein